MTELLLARDRVSAALHFVSPRHFTRHPLRADASEQLEPVREQLRELAAKLGALATWQSEGPPA